MQKIIDSVRFAVKEKNFYVALVTALTIPDICVALEHGKTTGAEYSKWFETNLVDYKRSLSGNDCYALRCSILHQGIDDISEQKRQDVLEHYVFLTEGPHRNLIKNCTFKKGTEQVTVSFLQLNVGKFCEDICKASEVWLKGNIEKGNIKKRITKILEIHEPGYTHMGVIKFGE